MNIAMPCLDPVLLAVSPLSRDSWEVDGCSVGRSPTAAAVKNRWILMSESWPAAPRTTGGGREESFFISTPSHKQTNKQTNTSWDHSWSITETPTPPNPELTVKPSSWDGIRKCPWFTTITNIMFVTLNSLSERVHLKFRKELILFKSNKTLFFFSQGFQV